MDWWGRIGSGEVQVAAGGAGVVGLALSLFNFVRSLRAQQERVEVTYDYDLDEATNESFVSVVAANRGSITVFVERVWVEDGRGKRFQFFPDHGAIPTSRTPIVPGDRTRFTHQHNRLRELRDAFGYGEFTRVAVQTTRSKPRKLRRAKGVYVSSIDEDDRSFF